MLAVRIENGSVKVIEVPKPRRKKGWALVRLRCAGICNTDVELLRGYYGFAGIAGHEFVGEVVEADQKRLVGKRVVGEINIACGKCGWCASGMKRHCSRRSVLGIVAHPGAFREIIDLPEENLHVVPDNVPDEHAVFTEPVAAAGEILDQVRIPTGDTVAVLGDGKLGLLIAQVMAVCGLKVEHFGRHPQKLRISKKAGVRTRVAGGRMPRAAYQIVVEATGSPSGLKQAIEMVEPRGVVVMKSTVHGDVPVDTAPVVVNEITLLGSRCGRFEPAIRVIESGKLRLDEMISARYPISEAPAAFQKAVEPGVIKVLLTASGR